MRVGSFLILVRISGIASEESVWSPVCTSHGWPCPLFSPFTAEYRATAVAGWNHLVFFGDGEGGLVKWDTSTGRQVALLEASGCFSACKFAQCSLLLA
jgi:hypothetical protein